jgi:hypothetical protein
MTHDQKTLRRLDDARNECRDVILYGPPDHQWCVWQAVWFASGEFLMRREQQAQGSEYQMRQFFHAKVQELIDDGFVVCEPEIQRHAL